MVGVLLAQRDLANRAFPLPMSNYPLQIPHWLGERLCHHPIAAATTCLTRHRIGEMS